MSERKLTWEEWLRKLEGPAPRSWINEPIDYEIDYEVREESARERADKRWHMIEAKGER